MPFYLWPMTSPLPVLAGCRLVMSGPCACFTSVYVQNLSAAHAFAATWGLFCTFFRLSLTSYGMNYFLIPHSLWPAPFRAGLYLIVGFFSFSPFFYSFLQFCISCCTILSFLLWCYLTQACWACRLSFSQWLSMVIGLILTWLASSCVPFSYWVSLAHLFFLGILGLFAFLGHPWPFF